MNTDEIVEPFLHSDVFGENYREYHAWKIESRTPEEFVEHQQQRAVFQFVEQYAETLSKRDFLLCLDEIMESYD